MAMALGNPLRGLPDPLQDKYRKEEERSRWPGVQTAQQQQSDALRTVHGKGTSVRALDQSKEVLCAVLVKS